MVTAQVREKKKEGKMKNICKVGDTHNSKFKSGEACCACKGM